MLSIRDVHAFGTYGTCSRTSDQNSFQQIQDFGCEQTRMSQNCQQVYDEIKASGADLATRALNYELDASLKPSEEIAVSYMGCLKGSLNQMQESIHGLAVTIGETTAKAQISLEADADRQRKCDLNPTVKKQIFTSYNENVPQLLQIEVPLDSQLAKKSCAQIETDFYHARKSQERIIANRLDHKLATGKRGNNEIENEYLSWKKSQTEFASANDATLSAIADRALQKYNVRIQCYNKYAKARLRCAILAEVILGTGIGLQAVKTISGLRSIARSTTAARTETVELLHWLHNGHFDIIINNKIYNLTNPLEKGVRTVKKDNYFERAGSRGRGNVRFEIAVTPEELETINAAAAKLSAEGKWNPIRRVEIGLRDGGMTCSGSVCALIDNATGFYVPHGIRASPTLTNAYLRAMHTIGHQRIISIHTSGNFNMQAFLRSQEFRMGAEVAAGLAAGSYVVIRYSDSNGETKTAVVPAANETSK